MAAYLVVENDWKTVPLETRQAFGRVAQPAIHSHGGRFITGRFVEPVEGGWAPSIVTIIEFPDLEQARALLAAPEFREAVAIRQATDAEFRSVLVEGVDVEAQDFRSV